MYQLECPHLKLVWSSKIIVILITTIVRIKIKLQEYKVLRTLKPENKIEVHLVKEIETHQ